MVSLTADPDRPFFGACLKVARAKTHAINMEQTLRDWIATEPIELRHKHDKQTGHYTIEARLLQPIPVFVPAILGDAIHNLWSALDLMTCRLIAEWNPGIPVTNSRFMFPFTDRGPAAVEQCIRSTIPNIPPYALRLYRRLKPYKGGNKILSTLRELDVCDKHRLIIPTVASAGSLLVTFLMRLPGEDKPVPSPRIAIRSETPTIIADDYVEIYAGPARKPNANLKEEYGIEIAFGEGPAFGRNLVKELDTMGAHVTKIINIFDRACFPQA